MEDKQFNKIGTGGYSSISMINLERRDRLRKIAAETTDLMKDPYFSFSNLFSLLSKIFSFFSFAIFLILMLESAHATHNVKFFGINLESQIESSHFFLLFVF